MKRAIVVAVFVCPMAASAGEWVLLGQSASSGVSHFVDYARIAPSNAKLWRAWIKSDATQATPKLPYAYGMSQFEVDCAAPTYRVLIENQYRADGGVYQQSEAPNSPPRAPAPESVAESIVKGICDWVAVVTEYQEWLNRNPKRPPPF